MISIDTGDTVYHKPTKETWIVACVQSEKLSWVGWPEGWTEVKHCLLVDVATDKERLKLLTDLSNMRKDDHRKRYAIRRLKEMQHVKKNRLLGV